MNAQREIEARELWRLLARHRTIGLVVLVLTWLAFGMRFFLLQPNGYEGVAVVEIGGVAEMGPDGQLAYNPLEDPFVTRNRIMSEYEKLQVGVGSSGSAGGASVPNLRLSVVKDEPADALSYLQGAVENILHWHAPLLKARIAFQEEQMRGLEKRLAWLGALVDKAVDSLEAAEAVTHVEALTRYEELLMRKQRLTSSNAEALTRRTRVTQEPVIIERPNATGRIRRYVILGTVIGVVLGVATSFLVGLAKYLTEKT